jgi:Contractile injection system tube protein
MERAAFLIEETGARLSCLLNPNTLVFRRVAGLRPRRSLAGAVTQDGLRDDPLIQTGGGYTELRLDLLFDVNIPGTWLGNRSASPSEAAVADEDLDVRDLTRPLWELTENQKRPGATAGPPRVLFVWGKKVWNFPAVVAAVAERLENFTARGTPQRSFLRLRLLRADDHVVPEELSSPAPLMIAAPDMEPEPSSPLDVLPLSEQPPAETYEYYVSPGHPLFLTAYQFFGDASLWTIIADANPDVDPVFVLPGTVLRIPTSAMSVTV